MCISLGKSSRAHMMPLQMFAPASAYTSIFSRKDIYDAIHTPRDLTHLRSDRWPARSTRSLRIWLVSFDGIDPFDYYPLPFVREGRAIDNAHKE